EEWGRMPVRTRRPQTITPDMAEIYFKGISTNLKPGDVLAFVPDGPQLAKAWARRVTGVEVIAEPDPEMSRTRVALEPTKPAPEPVAKPSNGAALRESIIATLAGAAPATRTWTQAGTVKAFPTLGNDLAARVLGALHPGIAADLYAAWSNAEVVSGPGI